MRWRSLGLLALTLAIVIGVYYALETKGKRAEHDAKVFRIDDQDVQRLSIERGTERVVVERQGTGAWRLIEPVEAKAATTEVSSLLHAILSARQERTIDERPTRLDEYGLHRPAIQLTLHLKEGKASPILLLGDKNPSGFSVYAKRKDEPSVFLVAESLRSRLERNPTDFRDKTLLAVEPEKVKQLELLSKGRSIRLTNDGNEKWELMEPSKARADAAIVRQLLWKIRDARVKDFLGATAGARRRYGLDHPDLTVTIKGPDGSERLLLRKSPDPKLGLYALADPGEGVVTTDASLMTDLSKSPHDLLDRSLLRFETNDVTSLTLRREGQPLTVTKEGDAWKLSSPTQAAAQAGKVYDLLYALKELRYRQIIADKGGNLGRFGLQAPQVEIEVGMADGSRQPSLQIGRSEKDRLFAKLTSGPTIYSIDSKFLNRIPSGPDALKQEAGPAPAK